MARSHGFFADLHTHTLASTHAYSTINEYAQYGASQGVRLFAMTDHGPELQDAPSIWHFNNIGVVPRMLHGIVVLRGIEANIVAEGDHYPLDAPSWLLKKHLDIVLAGFHQPRIEPSDEKRHTRLMREVIESGLVHIITHPGNPSFPIDMDEVARAAARCNVALEINNSSFIASRKGSETHCVKIARAVAEAGGLITLGSDAHHSDALCDFTEALKIVEAAQFPLDRIINTTPERVLDFLERHGRDMSEIRGLLA